MNNFLLYRSRRILILTVLLVANLFSPVFGQTDLEHLPAHADPLLIGNKVAARFLSKPYLLFGTTIGYPEVCTWYGALNFATLSKNTGLKNKLVDRFEPFFKESSNLIPAHDNVDHSVFGAIPLQIYLTKKKKKYLSMGQNFADQQWIVPDTMKVNEEIQGYINKGHSWQTRLWIDDMYMIIMLQVQAYRATKKAHYLDRAAKEMVFYLNELQKPNGLFYHAPDVPFFWGRGNGWMAAGMTEILSTLPEKHPDYAPIMKGYQTMMASLLKYQSKSGMWNQLIDDPAAWAESSGTGMFTYALITGVKKNWLKEKAYETAAVKGWTALVSHLNQDSDLTAVCIGTNKKNDKQYYLNRKRITGDLHGQAPVLWCAMALLQNSNKKPSRQILILGNSITRHKPAPNIGWTGDWGMAASSADKDFVHLLMKKFEQQNQGVNVAFENIAAYERNYWKYDLKSLDSLLVSKPEIIILRIGENVKDNALAEYPLKAHLKNLVGYFKAQSPKSKILFVAPFWKKPAVEQIMQEVSTSQKCEFLSINHLSATKSNAAFGQFKHNGVASHPSDAGMAAIANAIWNKLVEVSAIKVEEQQALKGARLIKVADGWAKNSVNTVVFRKDPLVTFKNMQYIAFYNPEGQVVLGKRKTGTEKWELKVTPYTGKVQDAHTSISLMVDGNGYIHLSWNHHNNKLHYAKGIAPGSLDLTKELSMTGNREAKVTYPQFFKLPNGNLIFLYRDGSSGNGNLLLNTYDIKTTKWTQIQSNLIDGEGNRNAYWQMHIDQKGTLHLSWVWRENNKEMSVSANHDICYAKSTDQGLTWKKTNNQTYQLPIRAATAEYAVRIPQNSELINQTSMTVDQNGLPYIAIYWRSADSKIPQYKLVYFNGTKWDVQQVSDRKTPFTLSGGGTKRIPISRPQILAYNTAGTDKAVLIFRDEEHENKVSVSICDDLSKRTWRTLNLSSLPVGQWEPTFDEELWKSKKILNLFVQKVEQGDGEGLVNAPAEMVYVLEWDPKKK